ncbi:hypothetical protein K7J14_16085 [Treponema zuelzerae]|uniref:Uncharacterized protein n=1 Tax=Teretinema zuelzerae TaxID=156 RepID=A0AAE3EMH0_9SPIR|nr:hypothetical protein [Teretinema zuelzerae]MCD1656213.1 hypothetical protein [Teretinema zuelzerae]
MKEEDAAAAQIALDTDEVSLGLYTSNIMVWDTDLKKAHRSSRSQKTGSECWFCSKGRDL